jgi:PadR family transcriptional regulator, regulatory protein PadR
MRLEQISHDILRFNQGTVYASLLRLVQKRWISTAWGTSDNNRRAKFYTITAAGRRRLAAEAEEWQRVSGVISRLLQFAPLR